MYSPLDILSNLQDNLNKEMDSENWKNIRIAKHYKLNCMEEIGEVLGCLEEHHWWKHYDDDKRERLSKKIRLELVDVLHFAISGAILDNSINDKFMGIPFKKASSNEYEALMTLACCNNFNSIIHQLFNIAFILDFNIMYYYIAKHTLNRIRKLSGYKDGSYKRKSKDIDDNDVILQYIPETKKTKLEVKINIKDYEEMVDKIYTEFNIPLSDRKNRGLC